MNLPPKAIQALTDLRAELLSRPQSVELQPAPMREELERKTPERRMRHARRRNSGFQRMCRSRGFRS